MRLACALALELVVAAGAVGGVVLGVSRAAALAGDLVLVKPAVAAELAHGPDACLAVGCALPRGELVVAVPVPAPIGIFGASDAALLAPLAATRVMTTRINHGGTSLSLRLDFESGARTAFKPEQIYEQSDPRKEVAAFALDRLLHIGRVPPAKWVRVPVAEVLAGVEPRWVPYVARRIDDVALPRDGVLAGAASWWVPELVPARIEHLPLDEREGRERWSGYLDVGARIPAAQRPFLRQLAALIVFDALVGNDDRWSGGNLQMSPDGTTLYTMDNTSAFPPEPSIAPMPLLALHRAQTFPRTLVVALRGLDREAIAGAVTVADATGQRTLLTAEEIAAVLSRRDLILAYIDQLSSDHGAERVLSL